MSTVSQEAADDCAREAALLCEWDPEPPPPPGGVTDLPPRHYAAEALCSVPCPDGTPFSWTVPAGDVSGPTGGQAILMAHALACKRAQQHLLCIADLSGACQGTPYEGVLSATGRDSNARNVWLFDSGTLPTGLTFTGGEGLTASLSGTPTVAGTFTFAITVATDTDTFVTRTFTFQVLAIDQSTLPQASTGVPYSQQLTTTGGTAASQAWSLASGSSLPDGLTLSSGGLISGTPTVAGPSTFDVVVLDTDAGVECQATLTLQVGVTLVAYWTYDLYDIVPFPNLLLGSTPHPHNLRIDDPYTVAPGRVGNCMATFQNALELFGDPDFADFDNIISTGFTLAGWIKFDALQEGTIQIWSAAWDYPAPGGYFFTLEFNTGQLLLYANTDVTFGDLAIPYPADGAWHFYRAWLDPADMKLRIQVDNGVPVASAAPMTVVDKPLSSFMLQGPTTPIPDNLNSFDETGFWRRPLTTAEALSLWNGGLGKTYPNVPP